jgi:hypothetical protein
VTTYVNKMADADKFALLTSRTFQVEFKNRMLNSKSTQKANKKAAGTF